MQDDEAKQVHRWRNRSVSCVYPKELLTGDLMFQLTLKETSQGPDGHFV